MKYYYNNELTGETEIITSRLSKREKAIIIYALELSLDGRSDESKQDMDRIIQKLVNSIKDDGYCTKINIELENYNTH